MGFKEIHNLNTRKSEAERIIKKYPERVPVICEKVGIDLPDLDKYKFLVPNDISLAQFMYIIRRRMKISSDKSIFLFVNNNLIPCSELFKKIYSEHKDEDGFLYISYNGESTFG
jgi:GABA(A) receptor-associated protein